MTYWTVRICSVAISVFCIAASTFEGIRLRYGLSNEVDLFVSLFLLLAVIATGVILEGEGRGVMLPAFFIIVFTSLLSFMFAHCYMDFFKVNNLPGVSVLIIDISVSTVLSVAVVYLTEKIS